MRHLNVLWIRHTLDLVPESYFMEHVILGGLRRPVRVIVAENINSAPFIDNLLVVSLTTQFAPYLAEARRRGRQRIMLYHLGDEHGTDDRAFYDQADLVLRNYWFDAIQANPKVSWVPNGYALGVGPAGRRLPTSQRAVEGFFAGAMAMRTLSDERRSMQQAIESAGLPFEIRATRTARDRLGPRAYAAALGNARFAPIPGGNSPETIRLYDALEVGAIPIMLRSRFVEASEALDHPPVVLLDDWRELPAVYEQLSSLGEDGLDRLQAEILAWWDGFKQAQSGRVAAKINACLSAPDASGTP